MARMEEYLQSRSILLSRIRDAVRHYPEIKLNVMPYFLRIKKWTEWYDLNPQPQSGFQGHALFIYLKDRAVQTHPLQFFFLVGLSVSIKDIFAFANLEQII